MKAAELLALFQEFYRDRLSLLNDHQASARGISQYHFNNTYQYVIAREEIHLQWVADAIARVGGSLPDVPAAETAVASRDLHRGPPQRGSRFGDAALQQQAIETDLDRERAFVERWQPRVAQLTNARHRKMLEVILGESLEHVRFFEEARAGHTDLLGRSTTGAGQRGAVLANRWLE